MVLDQVIVAKCAYFKQCYDMRVLEQEGVLSIQIHQLTGRLDELLKTIGESVGASGALAGFINLRSWNEKSPLPMGVATGNICIHCDCNVKDFVEKILELLEVSVLQQGIVHQKETVVGYCFII